MLQITVPGVEIYDESIDEFITIPETTLKLEHSLVSLSKWESKWCKCFFTKEPKTTEETLDYVRCMTLTQNVKPEVYLCLSEDNLEQIHKYIEAPMTATYVPDNNKQTSNREKITSELIYYWMITLNIPMECQKWHLNRLLTLVKVCNFKNDSPKKMSRGEIMSRNAALNAKRRKQLNSKG